MSRYHVSSLLSEPAYVDLQQEAIVVLISLKKCKYACNLILIFTE